MKYKHINILLNHETKFTCRKCLKLLTGRALIVLMANSDNLSFNDEF